MAVLNIYSLDDTDNQNIIACLPEGKHTIGRGNLLQVTDKRVSRQHAVIEVSPEKIYLTSVHINPCFFKAANGKTLTVLSQNQQRELNDGDQFSLLPESCWFKVKVKRDNLLNGIEDATEPHAKRNRSNTLELQLDSKRARLSTPLESSIHNISDCPSTSKISVELNNTSQSHLENKEDSSVYNQSNVVDNKNGDNVDKEIKQEPKENVFEDLRPNTSVLEKELNDCVANTVSMPAIKEEPLSQNNNQQNPPENGGHNKEVNNIDKEIKEEHRENVLEDVPQNVLENDLHNGCVANENDTSQSNDICNAHHPEIKTKNNGNGNQNDDASGSGSGANTVRRERCWYGAQCFRKNPNHRSTFAHPGDQDYDSDPNDDRPECPFGVTCYRKNPDHRRQYKHTGRPAPKPQARPTSPNTPTPDPPNQKKTRKAKKQKPQYNIDSSEEDYDFDDPFINDASSDDFEPSDGIDSDSDLEESEEPEESQERKRMLKEAKKFTRGKK